MSGFKHLLTMQSRSLYGNFSKNVSEEQAIADIYWALWFRGYHSNEISETDAKKADRE